MELETEKKYIEAGKIAASAMNYARKMIKADMSLIEAAEKIESRILEMGGEIAFPVDLSCNEVAAHYSPLHDDKSIAKGLLKIDMGVSVDGFPVDTASSIDLTPEQKYKYLINASQEALKNAVKILKFEIKTAEIGRIIEKTIKDCGFMPIRNLYGHELGRYEIHAGVRIPNYDDKNESVLKEGMFAIEPFATDGVGLVVNGKPSEVFQLQEKKPVRDINARKILEFIEHEYRTMPFSARWLLRKFGTRALFALSMLEKQDILHQYPQLIEKSNGIVSQSEHTVMIKRDKAKVLTAED